MNPEPLFANMDPWQQRVVEEKRDLDARLGRLQEFLGSASYLALQLEDQDLLQDQRLCMRAFSDVLSKRIVRFTSKAEGVKP